MICIGYACDSCKHKRPKVDGWKPACDAFPEGIPSKLIVYAKKEDLNECNNGIGYEPEKIK